MSTERRGLWALALFFTGNVCFGAGLVVHAFSFNFYLRELGFSATVMGDQVTAMTLGGLSALLPAGILIDRFGARGALLGGVAITTAALVFTALAREAAWILPAAFAIGAGAATCRVAWGPTIMRLSDETQRARAFTWNVALLLGSSALWQVLAGALPTKTVGVSATMGVSGTQLMLLGGAAITALAGAAYWPLSLPPVERRSTALRLAGIPREVRLLVALVALWMLATDLVQPFFNIFFSDRFAMPVSRIGTAFAGANVVTAVILVGAAELARRLGPRRALGLWMLALAPSLWALSGTIGVSFALALFLIQGLVGPATNPLIDQLLLERVEPGRHGVVAGWRNAAAELAGAVGAALGGRVLVATSFGILFLIAGGLAAASAALLIAALRSSPGRPAPVGRSASS
jgi:MFS family permease